MTRISSYPAFTGSNHYIDLYYRALEPFGFQRVRPLVYKDQFLHDHATDFDIIHIQWLHEDLWRCRGAGLMGRLKGVAGLWKFLRIAKRMGKPIVWTVHDLEPHDGSRLIDRAGTTVLARSADLVICHAASTRDRLVRKYFGRRDTTVLMRHGNYDGVFPTARPRVETLTALGLDPNRPTLVAVGSLRTYKGFEVAVEAANELGPDYQLIIAGGPNDRSPEVPDVLKKHAANRTNVRLVLKMITDEEMTDLYAASDCVLLPYRWITGSGALLTAFTLGRGVVASDLPFFRSELIDEPAAGVLVKPGDPVALAAGVREFFASDVSARHAAARRLADRVPWSEVVKPVVERLRVLYPAAVSAGGVR
jgi:glycosyltransferase involved in cell wall biosynthesis